jgi:hypothetical protein
MPPPIPLVVFLVMVLLVMTAVAVPVPEATFWTPPAAPAVDEFPLTVLFRILSVAVPLL